MEASTLPDFTRRSSAPTDSAGHRLTNPRQHSTNKPNPKRAAINKPNSTLAFASGNSIRPRINASTGGPSTASNRSVDGRSNNRPPITPTPNRFGRSTDDLTNQSSK